MRRRELLAAAGLVLSGVARADGHAAETQTFEVTVLGSGLAGLTAAAAALEAGARRVLILEKGPIIGGHSLYSSGSLAAVSPKRQQLQGIRDSVDSLVADSERVGGRIDAPLVRTLGAVDRARVMVARAIATDPDIVLADEPTATLDEADAADILDLLRAQVHGESKRRTVIVVTTDPHVAAAMDETIDLTH